MADDVLSRVAAAWRAAGSKPTRQRTTPRGEPSEDDPNFRIVNPRAPIARGVDGERRITNPAAPRWDNVDGEIRITQPMAPRMETTDGVTRIVDPGAPRLERNAAPAAPAAPSASRGATEQDVSRRVLTDAEWAQLSPQQQERVLFNNQLLAAYDADKAAGVHTNSANLLRQLRTEGLTELVDERLGINIGTVATLYDDLFPSATAESSPTLNRATADRRELISSVSDKISAYINELQNGGLNATAAAGSYTFDNDQARSDYEYSFDAMLNPANLSTTSWSTMQQNLTAVGYNPDDFKSYILDRVKLLPMTEGQSSAEDIRSWFS